MPIFGIAKGFRALFQIEVVSIVLKQEETSSPAGAKRQFFN